MTFRFCVWALMACLLIGCRPAAQSPQHQLSVDESALTLGDIAESRVSCRLPVVNSSARPVTVTSISGNCACTSITPSSFRVEPGATQIVNVQLNLERKFGRFAIRLEARSSEGGLPWVWTLQGRAIEFFDRNSFIAPIRIPYPDRTVVIESRLKEPVRDLEVESQAPLELVSSKISDTEVSLVLSLSDSSPFGRSQTGIRLKGKTLHGVNVNLRIPLTLERDWPYTLRPSAVNFGRIPIGEPASSNLKVLFKSACTSFSIDSTSATTVQAIVTRQRDPASVELKLSVADPVAGFFDGTLTARATIDSKEFVLPIPVTYYGE